MCRAAFMFESDEKRDEQSDLDSIHGRAPIGAFMVAGIATAIVFGLWLAFYVAIFLPRAALE